MKYNNNNGGTMYFTNELFSENIELDENSEFAIPRCVYIVLVKKGDRIIARPKSFFSEEEAVRYAKRITGSIEGEIEEPVTIEVIQHGVEEQNAYRDLVGASWKKIVKPVRKPNTNVTTQRQQIWKQAEKEWKKYTSNSKGVVKLADDHLNQFVGSETPDGTRLPKSVQNALNQTIGVGGVPTYTSALTPKAIPIMDSTSARGKELVRRGQSETSIF